mmetsp:Transcript_1099/g.984  ORF Transcript_1099/g.984 Transcript_1099/m.984 type:complete len:270 (-) Transcript_1099:327-1136(-)
MEEESIYNLIPKEYVQPPKQPLYRSKHNPTTAPTGTTFALKGTSVPKVGNTGGHTAIPMNAHTNKGGFSTLGKVKGAVKPQTTQFTKKGTGKMGSVYQGSNSGQFQYQPEFKKPAVPKKDEKPIMGLKSTKNYILANAVENMLAQPKTRDENPDWTKKQEYGKTPGYLKAIKEEMDREYEHIKAIHQAEEEEAAQEKFLMSEEEVKILRAGLKKKWEEVNKEYQTITHISKMDSVGLRRKKEKCEKELSQIEKDLEKLNKNYIFVDATR